MITTTIRLVLTFTLVAGLPLTAGGASPPLVAEGDKAISLANIEKADDLAVAKTASVPRASTILAELDEVQRSNAIIDLEHTTQSSASWPLQSESEVSALWNNGHYDQALHALEQLEWGGSNFVPGITWKEPIKSKQKRAYQDVRIGNPRIGADSVDLDFHRGTDNIFAAVAWGSGWSLNISTDGGATWLETYYYPIQSEISMKVGGDYVWVSYTSSSVPDELRMRRFFVETGADDSVYHFHMVADISPATIVDVAMTSNADSGDSAVYLACVGSDFSAHFYYDDYVGTSFEAFHPPFANASGNLDITMNPGTTTGFFLFLSYRATGSIQIFRLHLFGGWEHVFAYSITGSNNYTSISAREDTVTTMFEADYTYGNGVIQWVNYNAGEGSDWVPDFGYAPLSPSDPEAAGPDVSLRSPYGSILTYTRDEGAFDKVYYTQRDGHGPGTWDSAVSFNEIDPASQEQTTVEWLGACCVNSYGLVYLSGGDFIPYFDLVNPRGIFCDGFESGDASEWN
ncbi:MAG: hypothetical protein GY906_15620 [bacterium]|nr:hypothetical protein [bacterium]